LKPEVPVNLLRKFEEETEKNNAKGEDTSENEKEVVEWADKGEKTKWNRGAKRRGVPEDTKDGDTDKGMHNRNKKINKRNFPNQDDNEIMRAELCQNNFCR